MLSLRLTERIGDEYTAHYFYNSAANWCAGAGYKKAAAFFTQETANELAHAQKLQKYLVDWNVLPVIPKVETHSDFGNLPEIIERAYKLEFDLYQMYVKNSQASSITEVTIEAKDNWEIGSSIGFWDFDERFSNRISNLAGIEAFPNLDRIHLRGQILDSINISKNPKLKSFGANFNTFKKLIHEVLS